MRKPLTRHHLSEPAYVAVVLRVVVDHRGRLKYGEVVDAAARSWGRFVG
jgi:hypothetical protein